MRTAIRLVMMFVAVFMFTIAPYLIGVAVAPSEVSGVDHVLAWLIGLMITIICVGVAGLMIMALFQLWFITGGLIKRKES